MMDDEFTGLGLGQKTPRMPQEKGGGAEEASIDPMLLRHTLENLSSEQNLFLGVLAGAVAALGVACPMFCTSGNESLHHG